MSETNRHRNWSEALWTGLPHIFFVMSASDRLIHYVTSVRVAWNIPMLMFSVLVGAVLAIGWRRHWPRWTASWIGYGLIMMQLVGLREEYTIMGWLHSQLPIGLSDLFFYLQVIFCFGVGLWLTGRDRLNGLLVTLPAVTVWSWFTLEGTHSILETPLIIGVGLTTALTAAVIGRAQQMWRGLATALTANSLVVSMVTHAYLYHSTCMPPPTILAAATEFATRLGLASIALTGPIWGWELWKSTRWLFTQEAA